ncbi:unknown [Prevotella sp. CAG:891]|nr:unknown [Prevotella sp. CAG:891]
MSRQTEPQVARAVVKNAQQNAYRKSRNALRQVAMHQGKSRCTDNSGKQRVQPGVAQRLLDADAKHKFLAQRTDNHEQQQTPRLL